MSNFDLNTEEIDENTQREKKMTEKGTAFKLDLLDRDRITAQRNWRKQFNIVNGLLADSEDVNRLLSERGLLEAKMEILAGANERLEEALDVTERRVASEKFETIDQQHSDLLKEVNKRLSDLKRLNEDERSSISGSSRSSRSTRSSKSSNSAFARKAEMAGMIARLGAELKFQDLEAQRADALRKQEAEMTKFRIAKNLALAKAEMNAIAKVQEAELGLVDGAFDLPKEDDTEKDLNKYLSMQLDSVKEAPQHDPVMQSTHHAANISESHIHAKESKSTKSENLGFESKSKSENLDFESKYKTDPELKSYSKSSNSSVNPFTSTRVIGTPFDNYPSTHLNTRNPFDPPTDLFDDVDASQFVSYRETNVHSSTPSSNNDNALCRLADLLSERRNIDSLPLPEPEIFRGSMFHYPNWLKSFETIIESRIESPAQRLYYLGKYTAGEAKEAISGLLCLDSKDAYLQAKGILAYRYGNPFLVADAYRKKLSDWPKIPPNDGVSLRKFSDFLFHCLAAMQNVKYLKVLNDPEENQKMAKKLPRYLVDRWSREVDRWISGERSGVLLPFERENEMGYPPFAEFCNFISREARIACNPVISNKIFKEEESKKEEIAKPVRVGRIYNQRSLFTDSAEVKRENSGSKKDDSKQERSVQCASCKGPHNLDDCKAFLKLSAKERVSFVRAKGLCLGCLRWGHMRKDCRRRAVCKSCHGFHPTSLHDGTFVPKKELKENSDQEIEVKEVSSKCTKISDQKQDDCAAHSLIVPVWIHHSDNPSQEVLVYALLDDQSDGCFIKNDVVERMAVKGVQVKLKLSTVLAERLIDCQKVNGLVVRGLNESEIIPLPGTYSREIIPARRGQIPRPETARKWPHLERIADQLMPHRSDVEIGLLIGLNCARAIKPREVIPGKDDEPYAKKTALGWGVIGIVDPDCKDVHEKCGCHRILAREVVGETKKPLHFSMRTQTKEIMTPFQVSKMFELDFDESQDEERTLSYNDRKFMQRMKDGINQREDGHYEIPLPFKDDRINLPNNRELAVIRLMRLKGRLEKDETYRKHYQEFMKEMLSKGYAEKVPQSKESGDDGQVWYIPHHGVYHPQKKDKIRVVFDGSAEYKGESLNRHLLQGPDLTNNLSGVLCRFRKEPVALMCDIEGMFHQVKVNVEHRNFLRFLWWEDGDTNNPLTEYRMTVHLFGAVSSPGCSNFALKSTADDYEIEFGKEAAEFIRNDFYVDDGLKSVPTIAQAIALIENTKALCQRGGFNLHKFLSNSKAVIESIPIESRAKGLKNLDITKDLLPIERALGVQWCIESDQLQFKIELKDRPLTRRGILATVSSIYDPLGMVAPFVLVGKRILQDLTRDNVGWDDKVPESIRPRWEKWKSELHRLAELKIPRCYKPEGFGECKTVEIHNFSDASTNGYGQCSYLRMVNDRDEIHCALVMAKARVTPLRPITVPRLELTAALVSAKVSGFLKKELKYEKIAEVFWTDSKVVLGYISNDARRFHTFVANRVQQIRERSSPHQWKYVETSMNPADDASRGLSAQELIENKRWWNGPSFLWHPIKESQTLSETFTVINHSDPEVKKVTALATHSKEYPTILERVKYFSDWYRAKRAIVICKKFVQKLAWTINARKERVDPYKSRRDGTSTRERVQFDVQDLQQAETLILKAVQSQSFPEEMRALKALGRPAEKIVKSSSLLRLSPFLDENQVLRVGGRIGLADLPFQVKHPVILPKKCHVTGLVIRHYHQRAHQGKARTLADIRAAGLWIIDGSSAVGHYISKCVACRRLRGATQKQKMSDLPKDRLEEAPPFTYSAVDYFGPWYIKEGRRELKRYGVLFTCMASRAVHIETAASLTTDSFINAYRRFTGRRGPVRQLRSDQGTNFVGARNELDAAMKEMDQDAIKRELIKTNCDWIQFKMNVPHASHMGGVWERQIRSVRSVLTALLQTHGKQLDDESLRTLMIEAEAIVNSRPLTTNGLTEPDSLDALTPSHLLTMKTTIVMPPPGDFQRADLYSRKRWRRVQHLTNEFWQRWRRCYLQSLQERQKWLRPRKNLSVDDIVILKDADNPRSKWQLARIVQPYKDEDGYVRKVKIAVSSPHLDSSGRRTGSKMTYLERPIHKLVLLLRSDDN